MSPGRSRDRYWCPSVSTACLVAAVVALAVIAVPASAQVRHTAVTDQMLQTAGGDSKNWLTYGGNYSNTRFSRSTQINVQNAPTLVPRWVFQTSGPVGSFETTPLVVDGVMYLTTPFNHVIAVDTRTGKQLWRYEHKIIGTPILC